MYAALLRFYPTRHRRRFGEGMLQTFSDLLLERSAAKRGLFGLVIWVFAETVTGIVRENMTLIIAQNKRMIGMALAISLALLLALGAMQFGDDVKWGVFDFVAAGTLLFGAAIAFELAARRAGSIAYQAVFGVAIAAALLFVWAQLAVGVFGD